MTGKIIQGLTQGYNYSQILGFLLQNFPGLKSQIQRAKSQGYDESSILSFLAGSFRKEPMSPGLTEPEIQAKRSQRYSRITTAGLAAAALPLLRGTQIGQGILAKVGLAPTNAPPSAAPTVPPIAAPTPGPQLPPIVANLPKGQIPPSTAPSVTPTVTQPPTTAIHPSVAQVQAFGKNAQGISAEEMIKKMKGQHIAEIIAGRVHGSLDPHVRNQFDVDVAEGTSKSMTELVKDYLAHEPPTTALEAPQSTIAPQAISPQPPAQVKQPEIAPVAEKVEKPKKGELVITPEGDVGDIKSIKEKEALIQSGGKVKKVKAKDLEKPNAALIEQVQKILDIPEIDRSSLISYWSYDPPSKELFVQFHNGETYKYIDVSPEDEKELLEAHGTPVTEGENAFGAWSHQDPMSRGATMIQKIIANPKYKRTKKGEQPNPYYRKLRKGYDYWEKLRI